MNRKANEKNVDRFCAVYTVTLADAIRNHPDEYCYPVSEVPSVIAKMRKAFIAGTYNYNGRAIAAACKSLGMPHRMKAMEAFFLAPAEPPHDQAETLRLIANGSMVIPE